MVDGSSHNANLDCANRIFPLFLYFLRRRRKSSSGSDILPRKKASGMLKAVERKFKYYGHQLLAVAGKFPKFADRPLHLSIETTNLCNSRCVFCPNSTMRRPRQELDFAIYTKAIDQMSQIKGARINFCTTIGEPLLDTKLIERLRYASDNPELCEWLGFFSTLQWLHRFKLDDLFNSGLKWITVSITLSGGETYKEFFKVDLYEQTLDNLKLLLKENNRRGKPLRIRITIKPTDEPIESVINHPDFLQIQTLTKQNLTDEVRFSRGEIDTWSGQVSLPGYLKPKVAIRNKRVPCDFLYRGLALYSNGKLGACLCRDVEANSELIVGDLSASTVQEVWEGEKLREIRSNWTERQILPDLCKTCVHYKKKWQR